MSEREPETPPQDRAALLDLIARLANRHRYYVGAPYEGCRCPEHTEADALSDVGRQLAEYDRTRAEEKP